MFVVFYQEVNQRLWGILLFTYRESEYKERNYALKNTCHILRKLYFKYFFKKNFEIKQTCYLIVTPYSFT